MCSRNIFPPLEIHDNKILVEELKERKRQMEVINKILESNTAFVVVNGDKPLNYFFFTRQEPNIHRLDACIIHDDECLISLMDWHEATFPIIELQIH